MELYMAKYTNKPGNNERPSTPKRPGVLELEHLGLKAADAQSTGPSPMGISYSSITDLLEIFIVQSEAFFESCRIGLGPSFHVTGNFCNRGGVSSVKMRGRWMHWRKIGGKPKSAG